MTKEEKKIKRLERAYKRKAKRIAKDKTYLHTANIYDRSSISWGRKKQQGKIWMCEMGYYNCEQLGYCNGDC